MDKKSVCFSKSLRLIALFLAMIASVTVVFIVVRERVALPPAQLSAELSSTMYINAIGSPLWGASYELVSPGGTVIVADPALIGSNKPRADVITVSHRHFDHYDAGYVGRSSARVSIGRPESFQVKDVRITGIAANHSGFFRFWGKNNIDLSSPSDTIYVFVIAGLRIAHFGDLGQDRLSEGQLRALGKVDVVISKLNNPFVTFFCTSEEKRAFRLIKQLDPKVVIPTHTTDRCLMEYAKASQRKLVVLKGSWATNRAEIDSAPRRLIFLQR